MAIPSLTLIVNAPIGIRISCWKSVPSIKVSVKNKLLFALYKKKVRVYYPFRTRFFRAFISMFSS